MVSSAILSKQDASNYFIFVDRFNLLASFVTHHLSWRIFMYYMTVGGYKC